MKFALVYSESNAPTLNGSSKYKISLKSRGVTEAEAILY